MVGGGGASPRSSPFLPPPPIRPDLPVGARLLHFAEEWAHITQDSFTLQIVREGYLIPFKDQKPPLSSRPIDLSSGHPDLQGALQALLEKGAVERVHNPGSLGFYSRLFLVPKKNGSWRPIIDLSTLNSFVDIRSFKMETVTSIRNSILPDHWGVSLDLTDAYFHVPIHPRSRKYLRFCVKGQVFQFRSLPFGLATAPRVFTQLMAVVGAHLRLNGSVILQYFDDWLIHHVQRESLLQDLSRSWVEISSLGLLLNPTKSDLVPSQHFTFVGMNFLTNLNRVRVPPQRSESLRNLVSLFLTKDKVTARSFLSLLGVLSAASSLVELGRLYLRPIQLYLLALWRPHQDSLSNWVGPHSTPSSSPSSMVVSRGSTQCRCTNCPSRSDDLSDHGREQFGMGGSSGASRTHGLGHLVDPRPVATHKQPRVEGSNLSCLSVQSEHQGPLRASVNRQHDSSLLCTKTGGGHTLSLCFERHYNSFSFASH